ncbi:MAG: fasciclin domain-containing protein [Niabella sp.]
MYQIKNIFLIMVVGILLTTGCNKWDDHNRITDSNLNINLLEAIQSSSNLSTFTSLLVKSGYADTLASSRVFTVYAPTNDALSSIAAGLETNLDSLKKFVANHIAITAYYTQSVTGTQRIRVQSGKYHNITNAAIDDIAYITKDIAARNGVIQVIGTALPILMNTWEFAVNDSRMPELQKVLLVDSIGTLFRSRVYNLNDESKNFTFFALQDAAWQSEIDRYKPYTNVLNNADSTTKVAGWVVVKDLVVDTLYKTAADIPDTIVSKSGVRVGINQSSIVSTIKTSNGIVYILNSIEVPFRNKFMDIIIQGENYSSASANRLSNTSIRDKTDSATGGIFRDVLVYNHGVARFNLRYRLTEIPSIKYQAYWMALNDNINGMTAPFSQKIGVDSFNSPTPNYEVVQLNTYAEQFAGEFTLTQYKPTFNLYLVAANSTSANVNALVCNYIRLVPVFE